MKGQQRNPQKRQARRKEVKRRTYTRITEVQVTTFLNSLLFEGKSIKVAAQLAGVKYTSAKTILFKHRQGRLSLRFPTQQPPRPTSSKHCQYRQIDRKNHHVSEDTNSHSEQLPIHPIGVVVTIGRLAYRKS